MGTHTRTAEEALAHLSFPQNEQLYFECWDTSIFLITLRIEAPYRVPYLPVIPTFLVRRPMFTTGRQRGGKERVSISKEIKI